MVRTSKTVKAALKQIMKRISKLSEAELQAELDKIKDTGWGEAILYGQDPTFYDKCNQCSHNPCADVTSLPCIKHGFKYFKQRPPESWEKRFDGYYDGSIKISVWNMLKALTRDMLKEKDTEIAQLKDDLADANKAINIVYRRLMTRVKKK